MTTAKMTFAIVGLLVLAACAPKPNGAMSSAMSDTMSDTSMSDGANTMSDSGSAMSDGSN